MKYIFFLFFLFSVIPVHAQLKKDLLSVEELTQSQYDSGVFQLLEWSRDHTLFVSALRVTGLNEELDKNNSWTVFAPTNRAFAKLPREKVHELFQPENRAALRNILEYHIQQGGLLVVKGLDVGSSRYTTFNGQDIVITKDYRGVLLNGAYMLASDIQARNGIVHVVDSLILPAKQQSSE
jgi:uncharacterized surface protein with fasciclin (FAS1) repeats